eukprot:TRINITY_DN43609_c0_g1_i1.p1 TRINITY_DN43609_c0_g1~~TRINITY_DN43609_c0_g1_i1.p1  ORF type:complete len:305 (+),score=25.63 TRINITY_DN43609_c0_g1_i1:32-946(+)
MASTTAPFAAEPSIGHQVNSLRPTSAGYSFSRQRQNRSTASRQSSDHPGPGAYDVIDYTSALGSAQASAFSASACRGPENQRASAADDGRETFHPPPADSVDVRYPAVPCTVFGTESRDAAVSDLELLRDCPEARYGREGPGLVYTPNDTKARPRSAGPRFSIPRARSSNGFTGGYASETSARPTVAPNSYQRQDQEAMGGVQRSSRHKTSRASSFGTSSRFTPTKVAEGNVSAECAQTPSSFGNCEAGRKGRRPSSATFGSASRDSGRPTGPAEGKPRAPPRMPHPNIDPRKEIIKFSPAGRA